MKNYKTVPPQQRFMTLSAIRQLFGARPVVAYSCRIEDGALQGGYVIAVQNKANDPTDGIMAYMDQLKVRYAEKEPIFFIRVEDEKDGGEPQVFFDDGRKTPVAPAPIKKGKPAKAEALPDAELAKAVSSTLKA